MGTSKTTVKAARLVSAILRAAEIVCGSVVLVVMALFLRDNKDKSLNWFAKEFYMSIGISGVSVVIALLFMPTFTIFFRYFVLDFALSIIWFATFALLLMLFTKTTCEQGLNALGALATGGACNSQRAAWGFAFLSGGLWLVSCLVGFWAVRKNKKDKAEEVELRSGRTSVTWKTR